MVHSPQAAHTHREADGPVVGDALTLEKLRVMIANLPLPEPPSTFCSCKLFPRGRPVSFRAADGEEFHVAHPDYWRAALRIERTPDFKCTPFGLHGVPLVDLDANADEYSRVTGALALAMERAASA